MSHPTALIEGEQITHPVGRVVVAVTCIRQGEAYRASVHYAGTAGMLGAEVPELSQSWPSESEARAAARRACLAFRRQPADVPFAVAVEQALAAIAVQLDEAITRAMGGGDGTGRQALPLGRLSKAREALRTPAQRIAEQELLERLRADLERYDVDEAYRAACDEAVADEGPAQSWAQIRDRHAAAVERDRAA